MKKIRCRQYGRVRVGSFMFKANAGDEDKGSTGPC